MASSQRTLTVRAATSSTVTVKDTASATVTVREPTTVTLTVRASSQATVTVPDVSQATVTVRDSCQATVTVRESSTTTLTVREANTLTHDWPEIPPAPPNVVLIVADDLGLPSLSFYDDQNLWPASYSAVAYASLPWLTDLADNRGIRFNQCRVSARCTPTRSQLQTGRYPFRADGHEGTGLGDVQNTVQPPELRTSLSYDYYPLARVIRLAGSNYQVAGFGKWHLNDNARETGAGPFVGNTDPPTHLDPDSPEAYEYWGGPVEDGDYDWWMASTLYVTGADGTTPWGPGTGDAGRGYFEHYAWEFSRQGAQLLPVHEATYSYQESDGQFVETTHMQGIQRWLGTLEANTPFFLQWESHIPHSTLGALPPASGPGGATIHTTFTETELIPGATEADGKVRTTDPNGGYDSSGVFQGGSPPWAEANRYTSEGAVNVLWRREIAYIEAHDYYCQYLEDLIESELGTAAKERTLFIWVGDNGSSGEDWTPKIDPFHAPTFAVLPPTDDDTEGGVAYHDHTHMKGRSYEGGIRVPLVIGGDELPTALKGTTNEQYIDAVDLYPTLLDLVAPFWQGVLNTEGAAIGDIDGRSFAPILYGSGTTSARTFSFSEIFGPPGCTTDGPGTEFKHDVGYTNAAGWKLIDVYLAADDPETAIDENAAVGGGTPITRHYELYNLNTDPDEQTDLFTLATTDSGYSGALAQLRKLTKALFKLRYPGQTAPTYPTPL
jgi:arylsulfatase A-like enzyme